MKNIISFLIVLVAAQAAHANLPQRLFRLVGSYVAHDEHRGSFTKEIYWVQHLQITWASANTFCRDFNLDLVTLADQAEERTFLSLVGGVPEMSGLRSFIGGTTLDSEVWYWIQSGQEISFPVNWFPGEPNNGGGTGVEEQCMAVGNNGGTTYALFDATCYHGRHTFMCQRLVRN